MNYTILLGSLVLALAAAPASAAFRCTDKDGKTVYMERACSTYGYVTAKEVKDPPKGDGSATMLRGGQVIGSPSAEPPAPGGAPRHLVPMQCGQERIRCNPGDKVMCGGSMRLCDSD